MARPLNTGITIDDLEYAVEHLIRLAYSPNRATSAAPKKAGSAIWLPDNRLALLQIAQNVEKLRNDKGLLYAEIVEPAERACIDLECVIKKTLKPDDIKRMRIAIRQKRFKSYSESTIAVTYKRRKSEKEKALESQKTLDI